MSEYTTQQRQKTGGVKEATRMNCQGLKTQEAVAVVRGRKSRFLSKPLSATLTVGMFASCGCGRHTFKEMHFVP